MNADEMIEAIVSILPSWRVLMGDMDVRVLVVLLCVVDEPAPVGAIVDRVGSRQSSVSVWIDAAEQRGLVRRVPDGRIRRVHITAKGLRLVRAFRRQP
jgi:DNA-binding MarR family transcriptional regulator